MINDQMTEAQKKSWDDWNRSNHPAKKTDKTEINYEEVIKFLDKEIESFDKKTGIYGGGENIFSVSSGKSRYYDREGNIIKITGLKDGGIEAVCYDFVQGKERDAGYIFNAILMPGDDGVKEITDKECKKIFIQIKNEYLKFIN